MSASLLQANGAQPQKQVRSTSLFTSRFFQGIFTNRNPLRSPLGALYGDFYKLGSSDALVDGLSSEISIRLTPIRRPGCPQWSSATIASIPDSFYSFQASETISVILDTSADVEILTPTETSVIWTKTAGAGESYFQGVNQSLYFGDGIDTVKYIPGTMNALNQFGQGINGSAWLFSPVAPLTAPTLAVTSSGSAGVSWAMSSFYSTMGLIIDNNNQIEQLISVNALANNATQYGSSGDGQPPWDNIVGGITNDNTVVWTCESVITLWMPHTTYTNGSTIFDPITNTLQMQSHNTGAKVSLSSRPNFSSRLFAQTIEGILAPNSPKWTCLGVVNGAYTCVNTWTPGATVGTFPYPASQPNAVNSAIVEPGIPTVAAINAGQLFYLQAATTGGTTSTAFSHPTWSTIGQTTLDNQLIWYNLGSKFWLPATEYLAWPGVNNAFSAVVDTASPVNFWICTVGGLSGASAPFPASGANYGDNAVETTGVTWVCVGPATNSTWQKNATYYLPAVGFSPPSPTNPYGGAIVFDNNISADIEFCISSGFSGTSQPTWATSTGGKTTDANGGGTDVGVVWVNGGTFTGLGFAWTKGYGYVYAYKSRLPNDPDVTIAPPLAQVIANNPNVMGPLGLPTGAQDGSVSTASPVGFFGSPVASPNAGGLITIQGKYSLDPAIDTIMVFRSADGFQTSGPYLLVTEIQNITALATDPNNPLTGLFTVYDFMADTPSVIGGVTLPGLNELIEAPIGHINDPVPGQYGSTQFQQAVGGVTPNPLNPFLATEPGSGAIGFVYHQGRLWCFIGNNVFASGGPDTLVGNGFTAWPPTYTWPFQFPVIKLLSTNAGLLVFTTNGLGLIAGGPAISTYYSQLLVPELGVLSFNAVTTVSGIPALFSSDNQLIQVDPQSGISRIGHPVGNILAGGIQTTGGVNVNFNPANVYLTYHVSGDLEHALFIGDGATGWFRCDLNLAPDSSITGPVFSPFGLINTGHIKAIQSIVTSAGVRQLLVGDSRAGEKVLTRDSSYNIFSDAGAVGTGVGGSAYPAWYTIGAIVLANPGQMARLDFIEFDFIKTGTQPNISVLFDEISTPATQSEFESISNSFITDPPKLYGPAGGGGTQPTSLFMPRFYFGQTTPENGGDQVPVPAWCKFLNIKVDMGNTDIVQNETLTFTVFGELTQEK